MTESELEAGARHGAQGFPAGSLDPGQGGHRSLVLRGERVLLDAHLATLYAVEVRTLVQAVRRNSERFPADFMFQLTP